MGKSGSSSAARGTGTRSGGGNGRTGNGVNTGGIAHNGVQGTGGGGARSGANLTSILGGAKNANMASGTQGTPEYQNRGNQSLNQTAGNKVTQQQVNAINAQKAAPASSTANNMTARQVAAQKMISNLSGSQLSKMYKSSGWQNYVQQQHNIGNYNATMVGYLTKLNGMNDAPTAVSASQFDAATQGMKLYYRGVSTAAQRDQFQSGAANQAFDGHGVYGHGHYAAAVSAYGDSGAFHHAAGYGGNAKSGVTKLAIPTTAKIIDHSTLIRQMSADPKWSKSVRSNDSVACYAVSKGYDAISCNAGAYINILNRKMLIVQKGAAKQP